MTTTTHETEITVDPHVPTVRISRVFDAAPAKVFRAHTDAALFARWVGPHSIEVDVTHFECTTGGAYRYACVEEDGTRHGFFGSFHEVRPSELIVQTFTYEGAPDGVALERLVLDDLGGGRTRLESTSLVDSFEVRDAMVASGMDTGVREGYEKLDAILADH